MRTKISFLALLAASMLLSSVSARADGPAIGTVREEPGATLLLPFFEVDLANAGGRTTRFWINNASASAAMAHVTVWTDLSVPVLAFDVYLTGYDMQSIDMRDILNGSLPQTASAGQDPNDTISPKGASSQDINFGPNCTGVLPPAPLSAGEVTALRNALTGAASSLLGGMCGGRSSPGRAQGYVTVDSVNTCTSAFPNDPNYQSGGSRQLDDRNILWGDFVYANGSNAFQGAPLVAVIANQTSTETTTSGQYTFYGRYNGWTAADHRAPLATNFAGRYVRGSTQAIVWRDPKVDQAAFTCGTLPDWYPMGQEGIVIFDQQEHPEIPISYPVAPQPPNPGLIPFPAAAQKTLIGNGAAVNGVLAPGAFPVSFGSGWIYYNFNTFVIPAGSNPSEDPAASQAWIITMRPVSGSAGIVGLIGGQATQLDSASVAVHFVP